MLMDGVLLWVSSALAILSTAMSFQVKGFNGDERSQSTLHTRSSSAEESQGHLTPATIHIQVTFTISTRHNQELAYSRSKKHRVLASDLIRRIEDLYRQNGFPVKVEIESFRRTRQLFVVLVVFILKTSVISWNQGLEQVFWRGVVQRRHLGTYNVTEQLYRFTYLGGCCSPNLHLGFDYSDDEPTLYDDSGQDNVAEITNRLPSSVFREGKCESAINISSSGFTFISKNFIEELQALTIALWIKLNSATGRQPIMVVSGEDSDLSLEVINGYVQWLYSENSQPHFVLTTDRVLEEAKWIHLVAQYDSNSASAKLYIDGTKIAEENGQGVLRVQWGGKTTIGRHTVGGKELAINGAIDEFYIFHCALPPLVIQRLHRQCNIPGSCAVPKGKDELRVTLNLFENFTDDLADLQSPKSLSFASMLTGEIERMFLDIPGKQYVKVLQFRSSGNGTQTKLSVTSVGNSNVSMLESVIAETLRPGRIGLLRVDSRVSRISNPSSSCKPKESLCDDVKCLPLSFVCDGNIDCDDGTDELDCGFTSICDADELRCKNSKCVKMIGRCDGADDCEDNSDEEGCDTRLPGSVCRLDQFQCTTAASPSSPLCIARSFHCDGEEDCIDGSDEFDCAAPEFTTTPEKAVAVTGSSVQCTCAVKGVPDPLVTWRFNGRKLVPNRRLSLVENPGGWSNLTITDIKKSDMGKYTCEAMNVMDTGRAKSDCVVIVKNPGEFCEDSTFNANSRSESECVTCYCMGRSDKCRSATLYRQQLKAQFRNKTVLDLVKVSDAHGANFSNIAFRVDREIQLVKTGILGSTSHYWKLSGVFLGKKLVSYGGNLTYTLTYIPSNESDNGLESNTLTVSEDVLNSPMKVERDLSSKATNVNQDETPSTPADVKLVGRSAELTFSHQTRPPAGFQRNMVVPLTEDAWHLSGGRRTTRADLMNVLVDVEEIYILAYYDSPKYFSLDAVSLDVAVPKGEGPRVFLVEECQCPAKYQGLSCELCTPGLTWSVESRDCVKCSCNGHSGDCDPISGSCYNCQDNTEGSFCEKCKPGYYGDATVGGQEACQPCPCPLTIPSEQSNLTCFLDTDGLPTCDACPLGYMGRTCDVCSTNYTRDPLIPGSKCELEGPRFCDVRGSLHPQPDKKTRRCLCKPNVMGYMCEVCKPKTYNLDSDNPLGCTSCFCNGVIDTCHSSTLNRTQIVSIFEAENTLGFQLVTAERELVKTEAVFVNPLTKDLTYQSFVVEELQEMALYWLLPVNYTGNKVTSYGGVLQYTISFIEDSQGRLTQYPDVLIIGNVFSVKHTNVERLESGKEISYKINLTEGAWTDLSDRAISREQMIMALAAIEALMIRVSYSTRMLQITLNYVSMDFAVGNVTNQSRASSVEECACPKGYGGLSCQECKPGYYRVKIGRFFGTCNRCFCHGHADKCDPVTGTCQGCTHNTNGTNCDKCLPGFFGDATVGYSSDCQPCPCPKTSAPNRFSATCFQDEDSAPTCDACSPGHTGRRCDRCVKPYVGNPTIVGDYCKLEIECGCDVRGSLNESCDPHTKQCFCKANVEGTRCNKCKDSYFGLQSDDPGGCQPCFCFGISSRCRCAHYFQDRITLSFVNGEKSLALSDLDGNALPKKDLEVQGLPGYYVYSKFGQLPRKTYYWDLGSEFTGDKITSYGGTLRYLVSHDAQPGGQLTFDTDVELKGGGITLVYRHGIALTSGNRTMFGLRMNEKYWALPGGGPATKKNVMQALSSVDSIKLRATYSTSTYRASLHSVTLDSAVPQNTGFGLAKGVEQCECPLEYTGTSCQRCNRGFTRSQPGVVTSACVRCNCHKHSSECDPNTGRCMNCGHQTTGPQCDQCTVGFYGNPKDSTPDDCKPCPCPLTIASNQFSPSCRLESNGFIQCTACQSGYTGNDCGRCARGYTGNPLSPGGKCVKVPSELLPKAIVWPGERTDSDGANAVFYCLTSGRRPIRVTWARQGRQPLSKDRVEDSRRLLIRNVTKKDEGVYQCTVRNDYGFHTAEGRLRVLVTPKDPIVVTVSPRTLHVPVHHTAKFVCKARSEATSSVKWTKGTHSRLPVGAKQKDGVLTFPDARRIHTGVYTCTGSNQYSEDMGSVQLRVGAVIGPQVSIAPRYLTVNEGDSVQFRCSATGFPAPVLKWLGGPGGRLPSQAKVGKGILRIESAVKAQEGEYFCTAENGGGAATMRTVLYVRAPGSVPVVAVNPSSLKVLEGEESVFQCTVTGEPRPTITWARPGAELPLSSTSSNGLLRIYPTEIGDEGTYSCLATNSFGDTEGRVNLTVEKDTSVAPTATVQPIKQTVDEGSVAIMTCYVTGQPAPVMEWNRVGGVLTKRHVVNGGELRIDTVKPDDAGLYVCIAQNRKGVQQATGMLNVQQHQMPKVEIMPAAIQTVTGGETATFRCIIKAGVPEPSIQWSAEEDKALDERAHVKNNGVLTISPASGEDQGKYVCRATNVVGSMEAVAILTVLGEPKVVVSPSSPYMVPVGSQVTLDCAATGDPAPSVQWIAPISASSNLRPVETTPGVLKLVIEQVTMKDAGKYTCRATNLVGVAEEMVKLSVTVVNEPPQVTVYPTNQTVIGGREAVFHCNTSGIPTPSVRWDRLGPGLPENAMVTNGMLTLISMGPSDEGVYTCTATNSEGSAKGNARLEVIVSPTVVVTPTQLSINIGRPFRLFCFSSPSLPVVWSKINGNISDDWELTEGDVQVVRSTREHAGKYRCRAQNLAGSSEAFVVVTVLVAPTVQVSPDSTVASLGSKASFRCNASGVPSPVIKWSKENGKLPRYHVISDGVLTLTELVGLDQGRYTCTATNTAGFARKDVSLAIEDIPRVSIVGGTAVKTVAVGRSLKLECHGTGIPKPSIQWSRVDESLPTGVVLEGGVLLIPEAGQSSGGKYRCTVSNRVGTVQSQVLVFVQVSPQVSITPSKLRLKVGESAVFTCVASGSPAPEIHWRKLNGSLPTGHNVDHGKLKLFNVSDKDSGIYLCRATNVEGIAEGSSQLHIKVAIPRFTQEPRSFLSFKTLTDKPLNFTVEIFFSPKIANGLVLYNDQQVNGSVGDFVSFGMSDGFAEFRFGLGSGPAIIRSKRQLVLYEWHTVVLSRDQKLGSLTVDDGEAVTGQSKGTSTGLNLDQYLYVGGVPGYERIDSLAGFDEGFIGCLSYIAINDKVVNLQNPIERVGIEDCEVCQNRPCKNGGTCTELAQDRGFVCSCKPGYTGLTCRGVGERCYPGACNKGRCINTEETGFHCLCPVGFTGKRCEEGALVDTPQFQGSSFMSFTGIQGALLQLRFSMRFKAQKEGDMLLMYNGQRLYPARGDFVSLAIVSGRVEFRFDLGHGAAVVRSAKNITLGQWHSVVAERYRRFGSLILDAAPTATKDEAPCCSVGLNLALPLYLGGVDDFNSIDVQKVGVYGGFIGCVSDLAIDDTPVDLANSYIQLRDIEQCADCLLPCDIGACLNNGTCIPKGKTGYSCACAAGFTGKNCEFPLVGPGKNTTCFNGGQAFPSNKRICACSLGFGGVRCESIVLLGEAVSFAGDGYIQYPGSLLRRRLWEPESITLNIKTTAEDGVVLWQGQKPGAAKGDYMSISVVRGFLEFSFELGAGPLTLTSQTPVNDGQWHKIQVFRTSREGALKIDDDKIINGTASEGARSLNGVGTIFIGGGENIEDMTYGKFTLNFQGCVGGVYFQSRKIELQKDAAKGLNAVPCTLLDLDT